MYIGDELQAVVDELVTGKPHENASREAMSVGVLAIPRIPLDNSDRNRTSPFAFTGNKFEFRMPGSSLNIACTNIMLNTAVAEELRQFADELEAADDFAAALDTLVRREISAHRRILFNGNGYSAEWPQEAARRGLLNLASTPEALPHYVDQKNLDLFARHGVYSESEMRSRLEIVLEEYAKTIRIEGCTSADMLRKMILPACMAYSKKVADGAAVKKGLGICADAEIKLASDVTARTAALMEKTDALEQALAGIPESAEEAAPYCRDHVIPAMEAARADADALERMVDRSAWPMPDYTDLLFYV